MQARDKDIAADAGLARRLPTRDEIESAAQASTAIAIAMEVDHGLVVSGQDGYPVRIAPAVGELIVELLGHVASGSMVTIAPYGAMLTTQESADMLNVSRPHLTKLLKAGELSHEMVGRHRRVPLEEVMRYRSERRVERSKALDELASLGQAFDAG